MNIYNGMLCPVCETGTLEPRTEDLKFEYKGTKTVIPGKTVFLCPECEESFLTPHDERETEKYLTDERRKADGLLTSEEIRAVREHFQMTQAEFAGILQVKNWKTGQELILTEIDDGILLKSVSPFRPTTLEEVARCLPYHGTAKTLAEMDAGIAAAVSEGQNDLS